MLLCCHVAVLSCCHVVVLSCCHVVVLPPPAGLIVGSLTLCWFPNQLRRLMTAAVPKSSWSLSYFWTYAWLHLVADACFYLSSVLNPFLYNLSSRHFRQVFLQVLRCRLTVQHANRCAAPPPRASSARSLQPLLWKSLRFGRRSGSDQQRAPPTFATFQRDLAPSGCPVAVSLTGPETGTETEI